ncbi:MAG: sirohydrochlorin chelatase [Nocardioidaceae bacterium]|nr:sirohydrochlorin chelatase [Nocardioidaceae bacterium]
MSAPALIALAPQCRDERGARIVRETVAALRRLRPALRVEPAFVGPAQPDRLHPGPAQPSLGQVVDRLAARGHTEIVAVPLTVAPADQAGADVLAAAEQSAAGRPGVAVRVADPVGIDSALLPVLDARLRDALRAARVRELDALVLAGPSSTGARANTSAARLARLWGSRHHLPTSVAFASTAPPSTGEAVRDWRRQGRRHIAVGSLFITPGPWYDGAAELAAEAGAVAVSGPLGAHDELGRLVLARYSVAALRLVPIPV